VRPGGGPGIRVGGHWLGRHPVEMQILWRTGLEPRRRPAPGSLVLISGEARDRPRPGCPTRLASVAEVRTGGTLLRNPPATRNGTFRSSCSPPWNAIGTAFSDPWPARTGPRTLQGEWGPGLLANLVPSAVPIPRPGGPSATGVAPSRWSGGRAFEAVDRVRPGASSAPLGRCYSSSTTCTWPAAPRRSSCCTI